MPKPHKVVSLLLTLDQRERQQFEHFLQSSYWIKHAGLSELYKAFLPYLLGQTDEPPSEEALFDCYFQQGAYDKKKLSYPLHYLNVELERFLGIEYYRKQGLRVGMNELKALAERGQEKHVRHRWSRLEKERAKQLQPIVEFGREEQELQVLAATEAFSRKDMDAYQVHQQVASAILDETYFFQRLKMSCERLNEQRIFSSTFDHPFTIEVVHFLETKEHLHPLVSMYLHIYHTLVGKDEELHFEQLNQLIRAQEGHIAGSDMREIYLFALNYCIRKFRSGKLTIAEKALQLYQQGISSKILFDGGYLSSRTFTNAVKQALVLKRYDWIEEFIESQSRFLSPDTRSDTLCYNLADYHYHLEQYDEVLDQLKQLRFSDLHYHLGSRVLLLKTYYQMEATDALLSLLASFSVYLRRKKELSAGLRRTYLNFCKLLHKIMILAPDESREKVKKQIEETNPLAERSWLRELVALKVS